MTKLVLITGKNLCKIIEIMGFEKIHQKGSHVRYKHYDGRVTVVHGNELISKGLLNEILIQIKLDKEGYEKLRRRI